MNTRRSVPFSWGKVRETEEIFFPVAVKEETGSKVQPLASQKIGCSLEYQAGCWDGEVCGYLRKERTLGENKY